MHTEGCSVVSDSIVMINGDQIALSRSDLASSVVTPAGSNCGALGSEQCVKHSL